MPEIGIDFADERISMCHWYPKIADLDVPVPETELFELSRLEGELGQVSDASLDDTVSRLGEFIESLPNEEILEAIQSLPSDTAHIRGDYKASRLGGSDGARVASNPKSIHENLIHLVDANVMMNEPLNAVCVREHLDLKPIFDEGMYSVHPEIRFIVDEGEVLGWFVDVYEDDFPSRIREKEANNEDECSESVTSELGELLEEAEETVEEELEGLDDSEEEPEKYASEYIEEIRELAEEDEEKLTTWARRIAEELDDTGWSVDFVLTEDGEWYMTDMALYALYWSEDKGKWLNLSHIRSGEPYNLEENPPASLPDEPTDDMVRVSRR